MIPFTDCPALAAIAGFDASLLDPNSTSVVLAHKDFDLVDVADAYLCYLNSSWSEEIIAKMKEGFEAVHIYIAWDGHSHTPMICLVKFKQK